MKEIDVPFHEAGHGVVAHTFKVPITLLSTRPGESDLGRTRMDPNAVGDEMTAAMILVAAQLAEKRALGKLKKFNWLAPDDHDAEHARQFADSIAADGGCEGDVLEVRRFIELKTRSMLVTRWEAVSAIAAKLERDKTVVGEEVSRICMAEAARRSARSQAVSPPKPKPAKPAKKPRRPSSSDREVRPFTFQVATKED